ncbi:MAG TPA: hypothetical protein VFN45_10710, partial [Myxococcaceae bacterium]|nr:hypothetical protein [Myxococcaceae bacterium]
MRPTLTQPPLLILAACACASPGGPPPASPSGHTPPAEATVRAPPPAQVPMVPTPGGGAAPAESSVGLVEALVRLHGEGARPRAERGVKQVLAFWRAEDGDAKAREQFVLSA